MLLFQDNTILRYVVRWLLLLTSFAVISGHLCHVDKWLLLLTNVISGQQMLLHVVKGLLLISFVISGQCHATPRGQRVVVHQFFVISGQHNATSHGQVAVVFNQFFCYFRTPMSRGQVVAIG